MKRADQVKTQQKYIKSFTMYLLLLIRRNYNIILRVLLYTLNINEPKSVGSAWTEVF